MNPDFCALPDGSRLWYWDDFAPGQCYQLGNYFLSKQEILEFGRHYDPLTIHTDEAAAKQTPLGGLCASGIQTIAVAQKLQIEQLFSKTAIVAGASMNNLKLRRPVWPDQALSARIKIQRCYRMPTNAKHGMVEYQMWVLDQQGARVASFEIGIVLQCRTAPTTTA